MIITGDQDNGLVRISWSKGLISRGVLNCLNVPPVLIEVSIAEIVPLVNRMYKENLI